MNGIQSVSTIGLYLANLDRFADSYHILEHTARKKEMDRPVGKETTTRVIDDAHRLWKICERNVYQKATTF